MRQFAAIAGIVALSACQSQVAAPPATVDTIAAAAIGKLENAQIAAIGSKDGVGASGLYGKDAVFISERGEMTRGGDQITAMFKKFVTDPALKIDYRAGAKNFSDDGTMAYSTAEFTETYTDQATGKPDSIKGANLSVWRKQADGSWKLIADANPAAVTG